MTATIVIKKAPIGAIAGISAGVAGAILLVIALAAVAALGNFRETQAVAASDSPPKSEESPAAVAIPRH